MHRLLAILLLFPAMVSGQDHYLIAGTYTHTSRKPTGSTGIYVYRFSDSTGQLRPVSSTVKGAIRNPSYLVIAADGNHIYACTDTRSPNEGSVTACAFNADNGTVSIINRQQSGGANPVYAALHNSGRWLVNANYTGGSVSVFPIADDGSLLPARQVIQHYGNGADAERQEKAHVHAAVFSPDNSYLFAPDLGSDKIVSYSFSPGADTPLRPANVPYAASTAGSGPRHMVFHPNGRYAYCVEELGGSVTGYSYTAGLLTARQHISTYKATEAHYNSADIHISPDGRFLYATNRGLENNIAIFSIDTVSGLLAKVSNTDTRGIEPRNFVISPSGNYLLVANQLSGSIIVFRRDISTGLLKYTGNKVDVPEPSCLQLIPVK